MPEEQTKTRTFDIGDVISGMDMVKIIGIHDGKVVVQYVERPKRHDDMLRDIFDRNTRFTLKAIEANPRKLSNLHITNEVFMLRAIIAMFIEVGEFAQMSPFKWWGRGNWEITSEIREKMVMELIDQQHFLFVLALTLGMNADEFFEAYIKKNDENWERLQKKIGWGEENP